MDDGSGQVITVAIASICFLIVAGIVIAIGRRHHQGRTWARADGTILRAWVSNNAGNSQSYNVTYTFTTPEGQTLEGEGQAEEGYEPGDAIEIRYDPAQPSRNKPGFAYLWVWYLIGAPMVLLFLAFGIVVVLDALSIIDMS